MIKQLFTVIITCLIIYSCSRPEDATSLIGQDWVESKTKVYFIDTLTVESATFQFDSLAVNGLNRLLAGSYDDAVFGRTQTKIFSQLSNSVYDIDNDAVYDSIALIMNYDGYFYNDTIPIQRLNVFRVNEDIKPENGVYYNTTSFNIETVPIGTQLFEAEPKSDSLHISMDDTYGNELFDKIRNNDINNIDEFLNEYKGISIAPDESNTAILGFTKDSFVRMYYSIEVDGDIEEKTIDMPFNTVNSFTQTIADRTGTVFELIEDQETIIPSIDTDNRSFIQAGTGLVTRINIPHIDRLNDIPGTGTIIGAKLKFSIRENSNTSNLNTRETISAFITDKRANVISGLTTEGTTEVIAILDNEDPEFGIATYVMDFKIFLDLKLLETNEEYYLALYSQDFASSVDRYIFNGEKADNDEKMIVELTYAVYDD